MQTLEERKTHGTPRKVLAKALERELEMRPDDASEVARLVLDAFGGDRELDDEELSSDLRSVFYTLEDRKLLDFRREEYRNEEGHVRRAFYWTIRWDDVAPDRNADTSTGERTGTVYDDLPQNAWNRPSAA